MLEEIGRMSSSGVSLSGEWKMEDAHLCSPATVFEWRRRWRRGSYPIRSQRPHPVHDEAKAAANKYAEAIDKAKKKEHREQWLGDIDTDNVWAAHRYADSPPADGGVTSILTLKNKLMTKQKKLTPTKRKSKLLYETFFPRPPKEISH